MTTAGKTRGRWGRRALAALSGLLAAAVALGVAELVASAFGATASPVIAVGQAVITATPEAVKEFAIATFGENDKIALVSGTFVLLALFATVLGLASLRRVAFGIAGVALFGVVGAAAAVTRPGAGPLTALPSIVGAAAGIGALLLLLRPLGVGLSLGAHGAHSATRATGRETAPAVLVPAAVPAGAGPASAPGGGAPGTTDVLTDGDRPDGPGPTGARPAEPFPDPERRGVNRRAFLVASAVTVGVTAITGGLGRFLLGRRSVDAARAAITLPAPASPAPALPAGTSLRVAGITPFSTPAADFYRVDTAIVVPQVDPETWELRIHGRVERPRTLTYADLLDRPMIERDITLSCVSNEVGGTLSGTARWLGVPLKDLLDEVRPESGADQLVSTSADGFNLGTPTAVCRDGRDAMLAVGMNGEPLPVERGFPVRMLVPGLYGYVSATKWLVDLELTSFADFDPYWVRRGWKAQAPIKTFSRIDTPKPFAQLDSGALAVAGIAYAQHRGIDAVEVRVDKGAWQKATLAAAPASQDTWRQWSWRWEATPGQHTIECRATDGTGAAQPEQRRRPFPDGATGWHSVVVTVS